ncbi:MAG: hypothetical protein R3E87_18160 [Burkholderiaceae bacterium]
MIAVFNAAVAVADVAAVLDVDEDDVSTWLDILHGQQLVSWTSDGDHIPKARLIHDVVGEVIRKQMAPEHRSSMHGRICTAVVERHGERAAPLVGNLVYHAHEAGRTDLVVRLAPPAVRRALARYANREAVSILEMAIPAVDGLASTQANAETGVAFRLQAMMPLLVLGQVQRMAELLDQAQSRLAEFPNPALLGAVRIHQATIEWMRGQYDRASQAAADALTIAGQQDNVRLELAAKHSLATIEHAYGKYDATCALSEQIVSAFDGELRLKRLGWVGLPSVFARTYLGSALTNLGEFQRAATVLQEGLEIAELSEQPYSQVFVAEELAFMKLWMGESRQAEALLTQALERTERHAIHNMHAPVSGRLAIALAMNGRADAAIDVATKALTQRTYERAARYGHHFLLHGLAFAQASAGRHEDARATAQQLVSALAELGESGHLAWAWLLLSACAETAGDQQAAVDNARNAAKLAAQCGMLPTLGLARVIEQRCSRTGTALSSIATAEGDVCCPEFDREPMMLNPIVPVG